MFLLRMCAVIMIGMGCGILAAVFLPTVCLVVLFGLMLVCAGSFLWHCRRR